MTITGIKIDYVAKEIVMNRGFAKKAKNPKSKEYQALLKIMKQFPEYDVVERDKIKVSESKESYKGLTYDYMREFIKRHESAQTVDAVLAELENMIFISGCHSKAYRYPVIKKWFLNKYKEIDDFKNIPTEEKECPPHTSLVIPFSNIERMECAQ